MSRSIVRSSINAKYTSGGGSGLDMGRFNLTPYKIENSPSVSYNFILGTSSRAYSTSYIPSDFISSGGRTLQFYTYGTNNVYNPSPESTTTRWAYKYRMLLDIGEGPIDTKIYNYFNTNKSITIASGDYLYREVSGVLSWNAGVVTDTVINISTNASNGTNTFFQWDSSTSAYKSGMAITLANSELVSPNYKLVPQIAFPGGWGASPVVYYRVRGVMQLDILATYYA